MSSYHLIDSLEPRRLLSGNIVADFNGIYPTDAVTLNGISYFAANDGVHGSELWKSDGTAAGTVMVKDICQESESAPADLAVVNGKLLFFARSSGAVFAQRDLYVSDGTAQGTKMLVAFPPIKSTPQQA